MTKRIFVTGATGCIGHYLVETLIQDTEHELFLLVRDAKKLKIDVTFRPNVTVIQSDMQEIEQHRDLLQTIDCAILAATAWGGDSVYDVNVGRNLQLISMLDPNRVEQILYFSTASILDRQNQLLPEAKKMGNEYLKSKYLCYEQLEQLEISNKITKLFPTLVIGGGDRYPYSAITAGIPDVAKWAKLIRLFKADGSFHFTHGHDIAQVVRYLVDHPAPGQSLVLGNAKITVNQAIEELCDYLKLRPVMSIPLLWMADIIIFLFRIQIGEWDRFSMKYRHFTHLNPVSPATFGMANYCSTMEDVLKLSGVKKRLVR
jgi:nucleoside-diphosphate-sugar epimerase